VSLAVSRRTGPLKSQQTQLKSQALYLVLCNQYSSTSMVIYCYW